MNISSSPQFLSDWLILTALGNPSYPCGTQVRGSFVPHEGMDACLASFDVRSFIGVSTWATEVLTGLRPRPHTVLTFVFMEKLQELVTLSPIRTPVRAMA